MGFLCGFFKLIDFATLFFLQLNIHLSTSALKYLIIIASTLQIVCEALCIDQGRKTLCFFMLKMKTIVGTKCNAENFNTWPTIVAVFGFPLCVFRAEPSRTLQFQWVKLLILTS